MRTSRSKHRQHSFKTKHLLSKLRRQSSHTMQREPLVSRQEKLRLQELLSTHPSDHDKGNKAFDKDVKEGDDDEAEAINMNDGFIANSSYEQEFTDNESTTLGDETLDTLYFDASP